MEQSLKEVCKELDITYIDKNTAMGFIFTLGFDVGCWRKLK